MEAMSGMCLAVDDRTTECFTSCFSINCTIAISSSGRALNLSSASAWGRKSLMIWTASWNSSAYSRYFNYSLRLPKSITPISNILFCTIFFHNIVQIIHIWRCIVQYSPVWVTLADDLPWCQPDGWRGPTCFPIPPSEQRECRQKLSWRPRSAHAHQAPVASSARWNWFNNIQYHFIFWVR